MRQEIEMSSPIKLSNMVRYWQDLPQQRQAIAHLESLIDQYIPSEQLQETAHLWRQPVTPKPVPVTTVPVAQGQVQHLVSKVSTNADCSETIFKQALAFSLRWEGGWSSHPSDPGGDTMRGVTQSTYNAFRQSQGLSKRSVKFITDSEVLQIYRYRYWQPCKAELMVPPLAVAHLDTAINFGVSGAFKFLQEALGLEIDGVFGPNTQAALNKHNNQATALKYLACRIAYRHQRVKKRPSQNVFLQGWLNRDRDLEKLILKL